MKTKIFKTWRTMHEILESVMTFKELSEAVNKHNVINVHLLFDLTQLIEYTIDDLNDVVSEKITGSPVGLSDISYKTIAAKASQIVLTVSGVVNFEQLNELESELNL